MVLPVPKIINATLQQMLNLNERFKIYAWVRSEPWTFHIESIYLSTELFRYVIPMCVGQLYLTQTTCKEALHKRLFGPVSKHWIIQLLLAATF